MLLREELSLGFTSLPKDDFGDALIAVAVWESCFSPFGLFVAIFAAQSIFWEFLPYEWAQI